MGTGDTRLHVLWPTWASAELCPSSRPGSSGTPDLWVSTAGKGSLGQGDESAQWTSLPV